MPDQNPDDNFNSGFPPSSTLVVPHPIVLPTGANGTKGTPPPPGEPVMRFGGQVATRQSARPAAIAASTIISFGLFVGFFSASRHILAERLSHVGHTLVGVFLAPPDESKIVIFGLLGVAAVTFVNLYHERLQLRQEEEALQKLRAKVQQSSLRISGQDLLTSLVLQPSNSILVRAVQAVWQARNLQTPDLEAISASLFLLEAKRATVGRTIANRLLLLSLLGTIIGLAGVIGTLQSQVGTASATGDVEALLTKLQETLTTMGTAFASTAWGIVLSVSFAWAASRINDRRSQYIAEVQYFAVCELAPRLMPVSLPQALSQIEELVVRSESFVQESRALLDETRIQNVKYLQDLDQKTRESARLTAGVVAGIEKTIRDAAKEIHDAMANAGKYVVDGAKAQIDVARQLDKLLGKATTGIENAMGDLKTGMQDLSGASTTVQSAYKGLNSSVMELKTALEGQSKSISDAARDGINSATSLAAVQQTSMKKLSDEISTALRDMAVQLAEFIRRTEPKLPSDQEWARLQRTLERSSEASTVFSNAVTRLEKEGTSRSSGDGVTSSEMQRMLTDVTQQITKSISSAPVSIRSDLDALNQNLNRAVSQMQALSQQAARQQSTLQSLPRMSAPNDGQRPSISQPSYPPGSSGQQSQSPTDPASVPPPQPTVETHRPKWPFGKKG